MSIRLDHRRIEPSTRSLTTAYPAATGRVAVFLHGLVDTERSWFHRDSSTTEPVRPDFGSRLAADLSYSPVYLRYNTGRHISDNGNELVTLLSRLVENWPVTVTQIILIGHSMGGLVARSALHQAQQQAAPWLPKVTRLVCLGSPHVGAPLERTVARMAAVFGRFVITSPLSRLLALRSDGIKDLAQGYLHKTQWQTGTSPTEPQDSDLPVHVRQYFVTVTLSRSEGSLYGRLVGDLLVLPSSSGDRNQSAEHQWFGGMHHLHLPRHDRVYNAVHHWLSHASTLTPAPVGPSL
nr:alpha/beta hydrolase family protein [Kibdelosporangium phytohabitans]